ncbi:MAG: DUF934 domain-containing protein [Oceanospirillaceae bacterium]|nr:DUF934 domain-containing protein [Oceanospirillaceae bacterium]
MQQVFKNGVIQDDHWSHLDAQIGADFTPESEVHYILPTDIWLRFANDFSGFLNCPGITISADADLESLTDVIDRVPLIAIEFSSFTDGSGFSTASLLREDYKFGGELRAKGAILPDQVPYLLRCGFNSMEFSRAEDLLHAVALTGGTGQSYQGDVETPRTPFQQRIAK